MSWIGWGIIGLMASGSLFVLILAIQFWIEERRRRKKK